MRAMTLAGFDEPVAINEVPDPEPGPGQVRVQVRAASLNGFDVAVAAGWLKEMMEYAFPVVIGRDFAGTVDRVGEDAAGLEVGDGVVGYVPPGPPVHEGAFAQYVVLPTESLVRKPSSLDFVTAAALPLAGTTAMRCVDAIDPKSGDVVLIVGATGGVGSYAIQLAAARGATVLATGLPEDAERLRRLGAATVVDYRGSVREAVRSAYSDGVRGLIDLVSHPGPGAAELTELVREGGAVASTLNAADADALAGRDITGTNIIGTPDPNSIAYLINLATSGALQIDVEEVLPFEEAPKGLEILGSGQARGKVVIKLTV